MTTTPVIENETVPPFCLEALCRDLPDLGKQLQWHLGQSVEANGQTLGHLEKLLLEDTKPLQRKLRGKAAQKKADARPPNCPACV